MSIVDSKTSVTQNILDALGKSGNKTAFIPDTALVSAIRFIEEKGFPNAKVEDYKYCNIEAVLRRDFKSLEYDFNSIKSVSAYKLKNTFTIVVVNGTYSPELSDKAEGFVLSPLDQTNSTQTHISSLTIPDADALVAVNTAFSNNGFYLQIKGVVKKPIHIINIGSVKKNAFVNPRQMIVLENNAEATLIESFVSYNNSANIFTNHVSEITLGENAKLNSYRLQYEDLHSFQVNTTQVKVSRNANYATNTFTFGGSLVRNNLNVVLASDLCEAHLNGLFVAKGNQLIDNHTLVDHQMPNCQSNELYKGIAKDKSTGIFNGKIYVRKDAQKTNAYQSSKNILLSDDATINTKPQLEIYADDVKCSHGTSTGKVDEQALFYLKARGIGEMSARKLLLQAFAQEVIDKIEIEELQHRVLNLFEQHLK